MKKSGKTTRKPGQGSLPPGQCVIKIGGKALGTGSHAIAVPGKPTPQERLAARELQAHLKLLTGCRVPVLPETEASGRRLLLVGRCEMLKRLKVSVDWERLGTEGILIRSAGRHLALAGGQRGVLYACYTLLEDFLGVRWLSPDCTVYPKEGTFDLSGIDHEYVPPLEYREPFAFCGYDADWAARNKSNGTATRLDAVRGGKIVYKGFVHTFYPLVPPERHFAKHPEYFSEIDGQRRHEGGQLCLTNPAVEDLVVEAVRKWLRKSPEANIVSVSQNDWRGNCQCAACRAVDEAEGSPAGSMLRFVNRVAERIEKEFPHVAIDTLAYQYTRKPPKLTKPRPNVIVRLCSIECSFAQPLGTGEQNTAFREDVEGWGKICRRLYVWDYVTDFSHYIQPHPNLRVLQPNIRFFVKNGVKGIFEQGGFQSPGGEFQELRTWLIAKLLWNPKASFDKLLREFLAGYYGAAAPHVRQYIDLMHDSVEATNTYLGCYSPPTAAFLTPEVLEQAEKLFDRSEEAVRGDPVLLQRVRTARLPLLYLRIARGECEFREEGDALVPVSRDPLAWVGEFERVARAAGVTHTREGKPNLDEWLAARQSQAGNLAIERLRNAQLEVSILPRPGGRIWRLRHLPTGMDLIKPVGNERGIQASEGGYEEYSQMEYRSPGWNETYEVRERSGRSLVLEAELRRGLHLTRRIELAARKPSLRITSTLLNQSKQSRPACLRVHPTFTVSDMARASVRLKRPDGGWRRQSLAVAGEAPAGKEVYYRGESRPACEWAILDQAGELALLNRFQPSQVAVCYLNWSGAQRRVNLELWSPNVTLKPGESLTVSHEYELVQPAGGRFR